MSKNETELTAEKALELLKSKEARAAELKAKREEKRAALEGESKADAFKRIASRRVNNVLDVMATLENVFDANNYEFTAEQAEKIIGAVEAGLSKVKARANGEGRSKSGFEL